MLLIYRSLTNLLYPIIIILIFLRKLNKKEDKLRYKEKIFSSSFNVKRRKNKKLIWFHAASIGELKSIIPIIKYLNKNNYKYDFLITTTTLSSSNLTRDEFKSTNNIHHRFLPIDVHFIIKRFLKMWRPDVIFLVDSEIWPNLILLASKKKIPLGLINARITNKTFKKWNFFSNTAKKIFYLFDFCLASNLETKKYLQSFNARNIFYKGNLKFFKKKMSRRKFLNDKYLKKNRFWLAANTHNGEEISCINAHIKLKKEFKSLVTIIAPRHIHRSNKIKKLCEKFNLNTQVLDKNDLILSKKEVIIINSFGVLTNYYRHAKSVFIGKSILKRFEKDGGQSPIEAAMCGCKIYHGPYIYNFKEVYNILNKKKFSNQIYNSSDLVKNLIIDFKKLKKDSNKILLMEKLAKKIFNDNIRCIDNFLIDAIN